MRGEVERSKLLQAAKPKYLQQQFVCRSRTILCRRGLACLTRNRVNERQPKFLDANGRRVLPAAADSRRPAAVSKRRSQRLNKRACTGRFCLSPKKGRPGSPAASSSCQESRVQKGSRRARKRAGRGAVSLHYDDKSLLRPRSNCLGMLPAELVKWRERVHKRASEAAVPCPTPLPVATAAGRFGPSPSPPRRCTGCRQLVQRDGARYASSALGSVSESN
jgi:hypothetical protein